jgi:cation diffusion facilitator family transporter
MTDCCNDAGCEIDKLRDRQRSTLRIILAINLVMFVVEITAGLISGSTALLADSLDMLGDAFVYAFSLYVVARSNDWKAVSALIKGIIMAAFGFFVLWHAGYKFLHPEIPGFETMGSIGLLALAANSVCLAMLWNHRGEDINMRSVWLCSRNDIIANSSVLMAAAAVWLVNSQWPDLLVGIGIAALFLHTAYGVIREATVKLAGHSGSPRWLAATLRPEE